MAHHWKLREGLDGADQVGDSTLVVGIPALYIGDPSQCCDHGFSAMTSDLQIYWLGEFFVCPRQQAMTSFERLCTKAACGNDS
eukprot:5560053-Amphidinium_carterae.3